MDEQKLRKMAKESVREREKEERRLEKKEKHAKEACNCEERMDKSQMPEWAKALYHQNKAILAKLGIEE